MCEMKHWGNNPAETPAMSTEWGWGCLGGIHRTENMQPRRGTWDTSEDWRENPPTSAQKARGWKPHSLSHPWKSEEQDIKRKVILAIIPSRRLIPVSIAGFFFFPLPFSSLRAFLPSRFIFRLKQENQVEVLPYFLTWLDPRRKMAPYFFHWDHLPMELCFV